MKYYNKTNNREGVLSLRKAIKPKLLKAHCLYILSEPRRYMDWRVFEAKEVLKTLK